MKTWEKWTIGGLAAAAVLGGAGWYYEQHVRVFPAITMSLVVGDLGTVRLAKTGGVLTLNAPAGTTVTSANSGSSQTSGSVSSSSGAVSNSSAVFQSNGAAGSGVVTVTWTDSMGATQTSTLTVVTA
jgi:hypothetical protein